MKVIIYDEQNDCEINCTLDTLPENMPDHSSMSIELAEGKWANLYWSEWFDWTTGPRPISRRQLLEER
jgi:hypothetical protein